MQWEANGVYGIVNHIEAEADKLRFSMRISRSNNHKICIKFNFLIIIHSSSAHKLLGAMVTEWALFALSEFVSRDPNCDPMLSLIAFAAFVINVSGLSYLCAPLTRLSRGLVELNLARTGITAKGVNKLSEALLGNKHIPLNLRHLDLSENSFKGEDVSVSLVTLQWNLLMLPPKDFR